MSYNDQHRSSPSNDKIPILPGPTHEEEVTKRSAGLSSDPVPAIIAAIVVVVILAIFIAFGVLLFNNPPTAAVLRDIFIILLGIQSMVIGFLIIVMLVAIIYVVFKVYDLIKFVQTEVGPMLDRADDAVRTVQSRAVFISDTAVKPVVEIMAQVSAIRQIFRSFRRSRE
jgi:hypothetical protein